MVFKLWPAGLEPSYNKRRGSEHLHHKLLHVICKLLYGKLANCTWRDQGQLGNYSLFLIASSLNNQPLCYFCYCYYWGIFCLFLLSFYLVVNVRSAVTFRCRSLHKTWGFSLKAWYFRVYIYLGINFQNFQKYAILHLTYPIHCQVIQAPWYVSRCRAEKDQQTSIC